MRLTDAPLRARMGAAARARAVSQFSWAAHCRALDRVISEALSRKSASRRHAHPARH
jgi:glycosyltransferase involved in cell wall biosynthesis